MDTNHPRTYPLAGARASKDFIIEQPMNVDSMEGYAGDEAIESDDDYEAATKQEKESNAPKPRPGKKTRGRVKIKFEYISKRERRFTTFSKRKTGLMKKAYELSALTGTQVMLLVASETGHVYTFATRKLMPIVTSKEGKELIQTCLSAPEPDGPETAAPSSSGRCGRVTSSSGIGGDGGKNSRTCGNNSSTISDTINSITRHNIDASIFSSTGIDSSSNSSGSRGIFSCSRNINIHELSKAAAAAGGHDENAAADTNSVAIGASENIHSSASLIHIPASICSSLNQTAQSSYGSLVSLATYSDGYSTLGTDGATSSDQIVSTNGRMLVILPQVSGQNGVTDVLQPAAGLGLVTDAANDARVVHTSTNVVNHSMATPTRDHTQAASEVGGIYALNLSHQQLQQQQQQQQTLIYLKLPNQDQLVSLEELQQSGLRILTDAAGNCES